MRQVTVTAGFSVIRVEVTDRSGLKVPELRPTGPDEEGDQGLVLVVALAALWGFRQRGQRTVRHG